MGQPWWLAVLCLVLVDSTQEPAHKKISFTKGIVQSHPAEGDEFKFRASPHAFQASANPHMSTDPLSMSRSKLAPHFESKLELTNSARAPKLARTQEDLDAITVQSAQDVSGATTLTVTIPKPKGCDTPGATTINNALGAGHGSNSEARTPESSQPAPATNSISQVLKRVFGDSSRSTEPLSSSSLPSPPESDLVPHAAQGPSLPAPNQSEAQLVGAFPSARPPCESIVDADGFESLLCSQGQRDDPNNARCNKWFKVGPDHSLVLRDHSRTYRLLDGSDPRSTFLGCDRDHQRIPSGWEIVNSAEDPIVHCLIERFPFGAQCVNFAEASYSSNNVLELPIVGPASARRRMRPDEDCGCGPECLELQRRGRDVFVRVSTAASVSVVGQCSRKILISILSS